MYKLLFIDEYQNDIDGFERYVERHSSTEQYEIVSLFPLENLEDMAHKVIFHGADAIIVDFQLNEYKSSIKYNVPYDGVDLVRAIRSVKEQFPCFIMTSYDDDAIKEIDDVNIVYIKEILYDREPKTSAKATFLERVNAQIKHYKTKIEEAEKDLLSLIKKREDGVATISEEERIITLDSFLENAIDKKSHIPSEYKALSNIEKLTKLLDKVDNLLESIEKKNG